MKRETILDLGVFFLLVVIGVLTRFISGEFEKLSNFTAVGAASLFAGYYFRHKLAAALLPLAIVVTSDLVLKQHNHWQEMALVYFAWIVPVVLGVALKGRVNAFRIGGSAVASSVWFYLFTNFVYWYAEPFNNYPHTANGLLQSYIAAAWFFRNMLLGDLLFSAVIFGAYACAVQFGVMPSRANQRTVSAGL
jgi:hypothetical protein